MGIDTHTELRSDPGRMIPLEWAALAVTAAGLVVMRLHAFDLPLETDECNYAYIGGRLLLGDRLYLDVWDHQPPGVFVLFASAIALFGDAPEVFRWLACAFSLASLILIFAIIRRIGGRAAAIVGSTMFALACSDPGTAGEGCNREIFMNTLILVAWYAALRSTEERSHAVGSSARWIVLSGVALAIASFIKTIAAVHWLVLGAWILFDLCQRVPKQDRLVACKKTLACFAAGPVALWVLTFGYFGATARMDEFVSAVFLFNLSYSGGEGSFLSRFTQFFEAQGHPFKFDSALPLWIGSSVALVWVLVEQAIIGRDRRALCVVLLGVSGFIAVCLPARFWPHYYYLLIPPAVIVLAIALGRIVDRLGVMLQQRMLLLARAPLVLYVVAPALLFQTQYDQYISQPTFGITVKRYNSRDFWGRAQGENIRRITDPNDKIFVFGNDAEFYYYAQRRCASRYTMITALQEGYAGADKKREILLQELEQDPPRIIVVLFDEKPFDDWLALLERHYGEAVGVDRHDKTGVPIMLVFARNDQPIESIDWNWDRSAIGGWLLGEKP